MTDFFLSQTKAEVQQAIAESGIGGTLVQEPADIVGDAHIKERDFLNTVTLDDGSNVEFPSQFIRLAGEEITRAEAARLPGEDNDDVYGRLLGLGEGEIKRLCEQKVI